MILRPSSIETSDDATAAFLSLAASPAIVSSPAAILRRLEAETEVRSHVFSYADAFDSKDLERIVGHFSSDAILKTPRGNFSGHDKIREFYRPFTTMNRFSYHRVQTITVRPANDGIGALVAAYFHAPFIGESNDARSQYGRYLGSLVRNDNCWLFAEWRIFVDHVRTFPRTRGE